MSTRRQDPARLAAAVGVAAPPSERLSHVLSLGMGTARQAEAEGRSAARRSLPIGCADYASCDMHGKTPTASKAGKLDWLVRFNPQDVDASLLERIRTYADIKEYDIPNVVVTDYDGPTLCERKLEDDKGTVKGTVPMPRAMWNFYNQILDGSAYMSATKTEKLVNTSYHEQWDSRPNGMAPKAPYTTPGPGADGFKSQLGSYAENLQGLKWKTMAFYEATEWTPQEPHLVGSKTYVHVGMASGTLVKDLNGSNLLMGKNKPNGKKFTDVLAIDVHTLVRDPSSGVWKFRDSWHVGTCYTVLEHRCLTPSRPMRSHTHTQLRRWLLSQRTGSAPWRRALRARRSHRRSLAQRPAPCEGGAVQRGLLATRHRAESADVCFGGRI